MATSHSRFVDTKGLKISIREDTDDNKVIECTIADNVKIIVSGDKYLLKVTGSQDVEVQNPLDSVDSYLR